VTLCITIATGTRIFQSADYCVSALDGSGVIRDNSTKVVSFQYKKWIGNLTYSGIGMWNGIQTAKHVLTWMIDTGPAMTFTEVAEHVRTRAEPWLSEIRRAGGPRVHTFTLAGFEVGAPSVAVISNSEPGLGIATRDRVVVHTQTIGRSPLVLVTGRPETVSQPERRQLGRAAARCSTQAVENAIMRVNLSASERRPDLISSHCNVTTLSADGSAKTACRQNDSYSVVHGHTIDAREGHLSLGLDPDAVTMTSASAATPSRMSKKVARAARRSKFAK